MAPYMRSAVHAAKLWLVVGVQGSFSFQDGFGVHSDCTRAEWCSYSVMAANQCVVLLPLTCLFAAVAVFLSGCL